MSVDDKLDALMKSVSALSDNLRSTQRNMEDTRKIMEDRLTKFEQEVPAAQEDATERAIKKARRNQPLEFRRKGNEEQYVFNAGVGDRMEAAAKRVEKANPATEKDVKILRDALEELKEGMGSLAERQKHIRIADQAKNSWKAVDAYKRAGLGDNEEDNKRIKLADEEAEEDLAQERKAERAGRQKSMPPSQFIPQPQISFPPGFYGSQWLPTIGQVQPGFLPPPMCNLVQQCSSQAPLDSS